MKEAVSTNAKNIIMFSQNQIFFHGKDNTFRSSNPTITEIISQISY